ncbi:uncharacterized protein LY89DRAFT_271405 [Mollisia scopiformis]|uniref:Uncharacterized protein n=1 Tax=Mollisia scopiformis TaxID=149040 RepID=A0A132BDT8_MOLSC|nr:uncharacterized protein LY89DRAFT_271405 [Mollisia scopiformis]KUJ10159.1 hypothetical protein LY89DRAFT_271405 [Mollisia scopiformis]
MEHAMSHEADLMDWSSTLLQTPNMSDNLSSFMPVAGNAGPDWNPDTTYPTHLDLRSNEMDRTDSFFADWPNFQESIMHGSAHEYTYGNPGFASPSSALSVGSGHLSIGSGASSNHSSSSWRGRSKIKKLFSRSSSKTGGAKSAMEDGMPSWSLNGAKKHISPSPRRTGRLTDEGRAGMRLLSGKGACWKCKILKKSCDPGDPCKECTSTIKVAWKKVGCQRGALGENYKPVQLCPLSSSLETAFGPYSSEEEEWEAKQAEANRLWEEEMKARCAEIGATRLRIHHRSYLRHFPAEELPVLLLKGEKLKEQVVKAMKELAPSLEDPKRKQEVFMLLYHASLYEEWFQPRIHRQCNLIHLSIRCLNHSLDAIRSQASQISLHHACKPQRCRLHSIAKLQQSSSRYIRCPPRSHVQQIAIRKSSILVAGHLL